jgi:hypothetical protein
MAFEEGKCAGISIWILLNIDIAKVVVSLPYHIWQFDIVCSDDHDYMADGRGCSCIIHCLVWYYYVTKPKSKLYTAIH